MRRLALPLVLAPVLLAGCASGTGKATLAELHNVRPDLQDTTVDQGLEQAMLGYRRFLEETPVTEMTPEAMRRLADLQIERQFGLRAGDGKPRDMAAPEAAPAPASAQADASVPGAPVAAEDLRESDKDFERRTTALSGMPPGGDAGASPSGPLGAQAEANGPLEAIALYERLLAEYPNYEHRDDVLYQMARAYDELGRTEEAMAIMERLIRANPHSAHSDEVHFRQGEYFFTRRQYRDAENAYTAVIGLGTGSPYYELGLYKLGWTFYKQDLYEEALQKYMALLD